MLLEVAVVKHRRLVWRLIEIWVSFWPTCTSFTQRLRLWCVVLPCGSCSWPESVTHKSVPVYRIQHNINALHLNKHCASNNILLTAHSVGESGTSCRKWIQACKQTPHLFSTSTNTHLSFLYYCTLRSYLPNYISSVHSVILDQSNQWFLQNTMQSSYCSIFVQCIWISCLL